MPVPSRPGTHLRWCLLIAITLVSILGCSTAGGTDPAASEASDVEAEPATSLPSAHVHGVGINPADGAVLVATHDGLFKLLDGRVERVGPVIDLMGFSVAGPDQFLASGHPGPGVDLPNPVGLIASQDGGQSWDELSLGGQADFHALAAAGGGVVASQGQLVSTVDRERWTALSAPVEPFAVAADPSGAQLLITSSQGPFVSRDAGRSWNPASEAPLLLLASWPTPSEVVGVTTQGRVATSSDAGKIWTEQATIQGTPQAVTAAPSSGRLRIVVVTTSVIIESLNGGRTFDVLATVNSS